MTQADITRLVGYTFGRTVADGLAQREQIQTAAVAIGANIISWTDDDGARTGVKFSSRRGFGGAISAVLGPGGPGASLERPKRGGAIPAPGPGGIIVARLELVSPDPLLVAVIRADLGRNGAVLLAADEITDPPPSHDESGYDESGLLAVIDTAVEYLRCLEMHRPATPFHPVVGGGYWRGRPGYGWMIVNGATVHHPREMIIVDMILEMYDKHGYRAHTISKTLTAMKIPPPRGATAWHTSGLTRILKRERPLGRKTRND